MANTYMPHLVDHAGVITLLMKTMQIQVNGIATAMIYMQGHVGLFEIHFHQGGWQRGHSDTESIAVRIDQEQFSEEELIAAIKRLDEIIANGYVKTDGEVEVQEREMRRQQYLALKAEFESGEKEENV